jgi:putative ABC transport system permease protein
MSAGADMFLTIIYALLALAIIIALMGIANTLSLSVHERTRELGLLRAVGETRGQLRAMVRWESVIVATFGVVGGVGLGVFLGWALVEAAGNTPGSVISEFVLPVARLGIVVVVGAIAGVLAGLRPARRAARLDVLSAIATE